MTSLLDLEISPQPDDLTCGPTCLHAVYRFFGDELPLATVIDEVRMLRGGGTLDVFLANHALNRGYRATIYTYNLDVFDPTWFALNRPQLAEKLNIQAKAKPNSSRLQVATMGYLRFLELGGKVRLVDLTTKLIRRYLNRGIPIMTGLSATYLYEGVREVPATMEPDDINGEPVGHFVMLSGYEKKDRQVKVADPYRANPYSSDGYYHVDMRRLINAILLGIVTYDANLLIIEPAKSNNAGPDRS